MNGREVWAVNRWNEACLIHWGPDESEPDVMAVLARRRGWAPLVLDETMSIGIGSQRFEVKRVQ